MIDNGSATRVIDASTAHRVAEGWEYGFPEMTSDQSSRIAEEHDSIAVTGPLNTANR